METLNGIDGIKSMAGKEWGTSEWLEVTQERINQFADATGDHQWIHVDPERARRESPYGTTIAHGFLTLSLIPGLGRDLKFEGIKMGVNYGLNRVRFPNAVKVGSRIRAVTKNLSVEDIQGGVQVVNQVTVEIEGEDKPGCVAEMVARYYA